MTPADAWLRMALLPGLGPATAERLLVATGGDPVAVFSLSMSELMTVDGVGGERARRICDPRGPELVATERAVCAKAGIAIHTRVDPGYPQDLLRLPDPPLAIWMQGALEPRDRLAVAVVGPRRPSSYGHRTARTLSQGLARVGACVVSGLARGIDTVAHEAALSVADGRTVAVIGSGFGAVYPEENRPLAARIADGRGAVISEFAYNQPPTPGTFPRRNRIVAALALATLVVEAGERSGALITARLANELGRPVLVVPGAIDNPESAGANQLIRDGATLVASLDHILAEVEPLMTLSRGIDAAPAEPARAATLSGREKDLYRLVEDQPKGVDDLVRVSGIPASAVSVVMLSLELRRLVKKAPGGWVRAV
jgi:DNA processing protein